MKIAAGFLDGAREALPATYWPAWRWITTGQGDPLRHASPAPERVVAPAYGSVAP